MSTSEDPSAPKREPPDVPPGRTGRDRGADLALLVWLAGFALMLALLLYDLLVGLVRR